MYELIDLFAGKSTKSFHISWGFVTLNAYQIQSKLHRPLNAYATQKSLFDLNNVRQKPDEDF